MAKEAKLFTLIIILSRICSECVKLESEEFEQLLSSYKNLGDLGVGATAKVYKVESNISDENKEPEVAALKLLIDSVDEPSEDFIPDIEKEANLMMKADECSIIPMKSIVDSMEVKVSPSILKCAHNTKNKALIVQTLLGKDLYNSYFFLNYQEKLYSERLSFFIKLLEKVQKLHSCMIIHCDLKPQNILFDEYETDFYIVDFGYSTQFPSIEEKSICGGMTPRYSSPEYFLNHKFTFDELFKHDVYSVAVIILEMEGIGKKSNLPPQYSEELSIGKYTSEVYKEDMEERFKKATKLKKYVEYLFRNRKTKESVQHLYPGKFEIVENILGGLMSVLDGMLKIDVKDRTHISEAITNLYILYQLIKSFEDDEISTNKDLFGRFNSLNQEPGSAFKLRSIYEKLAQKILI